MSTPIQDVPAQGFGPTFRSALARTAGAQKTSKGAPAYSRFINRRIGRYFAAGAYALRATPNQVTATSALFTYSAILAIALVRPTPIWALLITLGLVTGYALDSADGQLARLQGSGGPGGEWLDHMVDCLKTGLLHFAVLVSFYRWFSLDHEFYLLLPALFGVLAEFFFFGTILTDALRRSHWQQVGSRPEALSRNAPLLPSLIVLPTDYGVMCLAFSTFAVGNLFLGIYALLFAGTVVFVAAVTVKWFFEVSAFGRDA